MGLEDIAMFRTLLYSVVLYPSDAVSTEKLVEAMAEHTGIAYLRTTRKETPILYRNDEAFRIGGSKVLKSNKADAAAVVAAGITLHEALKAYEELKAAGVLIRVIDLYSVKPVDASTLIEAADDTGAVITVEDHFAEGGIGEAAASALSGHPAPLYTLAVHRMPKSGKPDELMEYEEISKQAIVRKVKEIMKGRKGSSRKKQMQKKK
jgi:transketolase